MGNKIKTKIKGMMALCLVAMMTISMGAIAFAAPETFSITIDNDNTGHKYGAYQVFEGDLYKDETTDPATYILSNIKWGKGVDDEAVIDSKTLIQAINEVNSFELCQTAEDVAGVLSDNKEKDNAVTKSFADVVGKYLTTATSTSTFADSTYTIGGLEAGYYLVKDDDNLGSSANPVNDSATRYILEVVKDIQEIKPKSEEPTVEKKVLEDTVIAKALTDYQGIPNIDNYNDVADWDIGEAKNFLISAKLPASIWDYDEYEIVFNDTYSQGISITDAAGAALLDENSSASQKIEERNYDVYYSINNGTLTKFASSPFEGTDDIDQYAVANLSSLSLNFYCKNILEDLSQIQGAEGNGVKIVIVYHAKLNEKAAIGLGGNFNEVYLEYSNNPYTDGRGKTQIDEVVVFTFQVEGTKVDGNSTDKTLDGAEFILGKITAENGKVPDKWATFDDNTKVFEGWTDDETKADTLVSENGGIFTVKGLDTDTYYLKETKAPSGYNLLKEPVKINVKAVPKDTTKTEIYNQDGNITGGDNKVVVTLDKEDPADQIGDVAKVTIGNKKGSILPSTGDTGSLFFYVFGAIGAVVCIIVLITKRRMNK